MNNEVYRSPAFDLEGYNAFKVKYEDGTEETVLEHREVIEEKIGRELRENEVVHHVDGDKKNNNPENLTVMERSEHSAHHAEEAEIYEFNCPWCGNKSTQLASDVRSNRKKGCAGPFCSRSCAGKWSAKKQYSK
jgi:hypothetical protein